METILTIAIIIVIILVSMTLHEAMHAFVSYWLGDDTAKREGRLTLNPIKHIDPFLTLVLPVGLALIGAPIFGGAKPVPFNPHVVRWGEWGAALIAIAGPLTNLLIAFIATGVWVIAESINPVGGIFSQILTLVIQVNIGFFAFNILPIPPLDGSRVLYALAPEFVRRLMEVVERFGIVFIFLIVLLAREPLGIIMMSISDFFMQLFLTVFR